MKAPIRKPPKKESGEDVEESAEAAIASGVTNRAILAEAALQTIIKFSKTARSRLGIFTKMRRILQKTAPVAKRANPVISDLISPILLPLTLSMVNSRSGRKPRRGPIKKPDPKKESSGDFIDADAEAFAEAVASGDFDAESELTSEAFTDLVESALQSSVPALEDQVESLESVLDDVESTATESAAEEGSESFTIEGLAERAAVADAALQALVSVPADLAAQYGIHATMKKEAQIAVQGMNEAWDSATIVNTIFQGFGALGGVAGIASAVMQFRDRLQKRRGIVIGSRPRRALPRAPMKPRQSAPITPKPKPKPSHLTSSPTKTVAPIKHRASVEDEEDIESNVKQIEAHRPDPSSENDNPLLHGFLDSFEDWLNGSQSSSAVPAAKRVAFPAPKVPAAASAMA